MSVHVTPVSVDHQTLLKNGGASGIVSDVDELISRDASWKIDDQNFRVWPGFHAYRGRCLRRFVVGGDAVNAGLVIRTILEPAHAESLRIAVDKHGRGAAHGVITRDVGCERGFAGATFGIEYDDLVQIVSVG